MKSVSPEERNKQSGEIMEAWKPWKEKYQASIKDEGPLGKTKTVTQEGVKDSRNDLNYYLILEAASHDEAARIVSENPHLRIPTSFVDVMEIPQRGM